MKNGLRLAAVLSIVAASAAASETPAAEWTFNFQEARARAAQAAPVFAKARTPKKPDAKDLLLKTRDFVFGPVGTGGPISQEEMAFRKLMQAPTAKEDFKLLLRNGTNEAKLYALCALRELEPDRYPEHAKALRSANPQVSVVAGCLGTMEEAAKIIGRIDAGDYDYYVHIRGNPPMVP